MKEIGGYLEFERYHGEMLHEKAIKTNSGRSCLAYLIKSRGIKKIALPKFLCDCIIDTCIKMKVEIRYYHIGYDFTPEEILLDDEEWIYIINYYGQISRNTILELYRRQKRIILDNSHAYFDSPLENIDTFYSCRKFFGVSDGGILYSDNSINIEEIDVSIDRVPVLVGRYEISASRYYNKFVENEEHFYNEPIKKMSLFTENLLHSFDYCGIKEKRRRNFEYLHNKLSNINHLNIVVPEGPYMYPLMIRGADKIKSTI